MPGTCLRGEPVCSTKSCVKACPFSRQITDSSDGDRSRSPSPNKGPESTSASSIPREDNAQQRSPNAINEEQTGKGQSVDKTTMAEWEGPPPRPEDTSECSCPNNSGSPAWLTISTHDQMSCEECCGMPIRSDTPIAELAREWIRFRNAEDTGTWVPCPGEGVFVDSPPMLRFVHYMRGQYKGGCGFSGMDICPETCEGKAQPQKARNSATAGGACPPTCPIVQSRLSGRNRSPSTGVERDSSFSRRPSKAGSPSGSPSRMAVCPPCEAAANLTSVREERERIGEIAEGLRRAVQGQSTTSGQCCPCCTPCFTKRMSPKPRAPSPYQKDNSSMSRPYDYSPEFDPRLCGPSCRIDEDQPAYYDNSQPRYGGSRYWVDDETKPRVGGQPMQPSQPSQARQPAPRLSRVRSTSQCSPCGGTVRASTTSYASSPVAVFNFNECAATFQQHLHPQDGEDCPDECPDTCPAL